jgi:hypothetical protein
MAAGSGRSAAAQLLLDLRSPEPERLVVVPVSVVVAAPASEPEVVVAAPVEVLGALGEVALLAEEPDVLGVAGVLRVVEVLGVAVVVVVPLVAPLVPDVPVADPLAATLSPASWTLSAALFATCSTRAPRLPGALSMTRLTCGWSSTWRALAVICS